MKPRHDAQRLTQAEYKGGLVYADDLDWGDCGPGFFHNLRDLTDAFARRDLDLPERVFGCVEKRLHIIADDMLEGEFERNEWFDEAIDHVDRTAIDGLQALLDDWCAKNAPPSHEPVDSIVMVFSDEDRTYHAEKRTVHRQRRGGLHLVRPEGSP